MPAPWPVEVVPCSPVACGTTLWRMEGLLRVTIVIKATFGLVPDGQARLIAPEEIVTRDHHVDRNPVASVEAASEIAPYLPRAGVVLTGHAYAPAGRSVPALSARLSIFRERVLLDKTVHVFGDRDAASPGQPRPFQRMPLRWERAYGGPSVGDNPVGTGAVPGSALPNIVDPREPQRPAGFGPIAGTWPVRRRLVDASRRAQIHAAVPDLGASFPFGYFQPAPPDQQLDSIEGDEWIVLDGMDPTLPRLRARLPSVRGAARAGFSTSAGLGDLQPVDVAADQLVIDADRRVCSVIWRGHLIVGDGAEAPAGLTLFAGIELAGRPLAWPTASAAAIAAPGAAPPAPPAAVAALARSAPVPAQAPPAGPAMAADWILDKDEDSDDGEDDEGDFGNSTATGVFSPDELKPALPFLAARPAAPPPPAPPPVAAPPPEIEASTALFSITDLLAQATRAVAPFEIAAPGTASAPATLAGTPWAPEGAPPVAAPGMLDERTHEPGGEIRRPWDLPERSSLPAEPPGEAALPGALPGIPARGALPPKRKGEVIPTAVAGPLAIATTAWQVKPPQDSLTVIVKAGFELVPDAPARMLAEPELPMGDLYLDDDPEKSLAYASDYAVFKPRADVTLTGHAHAPGGSAPAMQVTFRFGSGKGRLDRTLFVFGERRWQKSVVTLAPTDPEPFTSLPIVYERAFGGPRYDKNPVGVGHRAAAGAEGVARLPNMEIPGSLVTGSGDTPEPACFAPQPPMWKARWSRLGTYDRRWFSTRWPYFPEDFDWTFFQAAPAAQQLEAIAGDEPYEIVGLFPDRPSLSGKLPGLRARAFAQKTAAAGGGFQEIALRLDTVAFDADARKVALVWRGLLEVSDEDAPEIEGLFAMAEPMREAPASIEEARLRYLAVIAPRKPVEESPEAPAAPANDAEPDPEAAAVDEEIAAMEEAMAEREAELTAAMDAAGIPEAAAPAPRPDPEAVIEGLRAAGASDEEIAEAREALGPPPPDEDEPEPPPPPPDLRERVIARMRAGEPLDGLDLGRADLSDLDFSGRSLEGTLLDHANLQRSSFAGSKLAGAQLGGADLSGADLREADLGRADLSGADLSGARFEGADLSGANLTGAKGAGASFAGAKGAKAVFAGGAWEGVSFEGFAGPGADFSGAAIGGCSFRSASLADMRLYDARGAGVIFDGAALPNARAEGAALPRSSFRGVAAEGSVWERAILDESSFQGANFKGSSFLRASSMKANFSGADLTEARMRRARLGGALFLKANLMMAVLDRADLTIADLRGANLHGAGLWKATITDAKLDSAILTKSTLTARRSP
ncbi:MAG: DUF2169 domain-containing protein [Byssovorax sp.]